MKDEEMLQDFLVGLPKPWHESFGIGGVWISPAGLWIKLGHGLVTFGDSVSDTLQAGPCDTAACCDVLRVERLKVFASLIRYTGVRKVAASVTVSFPCHYLLCKVSPATSIWATGKSVHAMQESFHMRSWLVFMSWKHGNRYGELPKPIP